MPDYHRAMGHRAWTVAAAGLLILGGCATRTPQPPNTGRITVGVTTTGGGAGSRTFQVSVEPAGAAGSVAADAGVFSVPAAAAGSHVVRLSVPRECTVEAGAERTVRVTAGASATVRFVVRCDP